MRSSEIAELDQGPQHVGRSSTKRAVFDFLRAQHGAGAVIDREIAHPRPADWLVGINAARAVRECAQALMADWARQARRDGFSWRDLAGPLGAADDEDDPRLAAWDLVTGPPPMLHDPRYFPWDCPSCGQWIKDYGPRSNDPADTEAGHTEGCARHQAEIAAYLERITS